MSATKTAPRPVSINEMLTEAERALEDRKRFYWMLCDRHQMNRREAARRIDALMAMVEMLKRMRDDPTNQPEGAP